MRRTATCFVAVLAIAACRQAPGGNSPETGATAAVAGEAPPSREASADHRSLGAAGQPAGPVTFTKDVAPILYANCVTCHRPGQIAPFPLTSYADASKRADEIADVTAAREMPPWPAEAGEIAFLNERRLREDQIALLRKWASSGAAEGSRSDLPPLPSFPEGWQLGQPDLVVAMRKPFVLPAGTGDRYRQIVFPAPVSEGRFVRAVELQTGAAPIHHAVIRIDRTHSSRRRDAEDSEPGFDGLMVADARNPEGHFVGWSPGRGPIVAPAGMPWRLEGGADLVVELHLVPGNSPAAVQPTIGLFFSDKPPSETPVELTMGVMTLDIPAGEPAYRVRTNYVLPVDVSLLSLFPHAHYLGREMQILATLPDGSVKRLLRIPRWDFHWQTEYRLASPLVLPQGTTVSMQYTFDNSAANGDNPSSPPKRVMYGLHSTDEMANLSLQVLPRSAADGRKLMKSMIEMQTRENVAGAELKVRVDARNPQYQWELGRSYVEAGRMTDAIAPLEIAVRSDPRFARAHDFLGRALFAARRPAEALPHFRRAVALDPRDELLHFDLGKVLADTGQLNEAVKSFQRALTIKPEYGQAYEGLGVAFIRLGRFPAAVTAFRRAVALQPDSASAENGLAVALAQAGNAIEAIAHVRRALAIDPDFQPAKDNLARMTGR